MSEEKQPGLSKQNMYNVNVSLASKEEELPLFKEQAIMQNEKRSSHYFIRREDIWVGRLVGENKTNEQYVQYEIASNQLSTIFAQTIMHLKKKIDERLANEFGADQMDAVKGFLKLRERDAAAESWTDYIGSLVALIRDKDQRNVRFEAVQIKLIENIPIDKEGVMGCYTSKEVGKEIGTAK